MTAIEKAQPDQALEQLLKESGEEFDRKFHEGEYGTLEARHKSVTDFLTAAITKAFHAGADAQIERDAKVVEGNKQMFKHFDCADGKREMCDDCLFRQMMNKKVDRIAVAIRSQAPEKKCCDKCRGSVVIARVGGGDWGRKEKCQSPNCDCHAPEQPTQKPLQEEKKDV